MIPHVTTHASRATARSSRHFIGSLLALGVLLGGSAVPSAHAQSLKLGRDFNPFYVSATNLTVRPGEVINLDHVQDAGGDADGVLDGELLAGTYCVNLTNPVTLGRTYSATTVSSDGKVFGESIQNADKISWLMINLAGSATTSDLQAGLQAAIWRTEYGSGFEVDGVDNNKTGNTAGMMAAYSSALTQLGSNTASVSDVLWISPVSDLSKGDTLPNNPNLHFQGLVGARFSQIAASGSSAAPEPGTIALMLMAGVPMAGLVRRRAKRCVWAA